MLVDDLAHRVRILVAVDGGVDVLIAEDAGVGLGALAGHGSGLGVLSPTAAWLRYQRRCWPLYSTLLHIRIGSMRFHLA